MASSLASDAPVAFYFIAPYPGGNWQESAPADRFVEARAVIPREQNAAGVTIYFSPAFL